MTDIMECKIVLLDIEGTTTSIKFVKDVLFSYARENLRKCIYDRWEEEEMKEIVSLLLEQQIQDLVDNSNVVPLTGNGDDEKKKGSVIENVLWQMESDRKTYSLKKLQGYIWRDGFGSGDLKGHIYDDVVPALKQWVKDGLRLFVFSSGSVEAQRLHFGHSEKGNLLDLFTGHFDTSVGPKIEVSSYRAIAEKIDEIPRNILFITDVIAEAEAAAEAGFLVVISERPGNVPIPESYREKFKFIQTFDQLSLSLSL